MQAKIVARERVYDGWYKLDRLTVRMPDGAEVERHLEDHGNAIAVLPYDPERRVALLLTMPRAPVIDAGLPPILEVIAGTIEREDIAEQARTEAMEEAGLELELLEPVVNLWSMPSFSRERAQLYLACYSAGQRIGAGGGAPEEHENITVSEIPLAELRRMTDAGRLEDAKTLVLVLALRLRRPGLFEDFGG